MLIAAVSLLFAVLAFVSARSLYRRSHVFFLLCTAVEGWFRRGSLSGKREMDPVQPKLEGQPRRSY